MNALHPNFHGAGESTTDLRDKMFRGRIPGGVAILWNCKLDPVVTVVRLNVDWAIAIEFKCNGRTFIILNIYTPFEPYDNVDEYCNRFVNAFIEDYGSTCAYVVGDFNADISDDNSLFAKQLLQFCYANNLNI